MACNCSNCPNLITVTSVTAVNGVTTITVPTGTVFTANKNYCLGLFSSIPNGTNGNQVNVTNGTVTYTIYNRLANYWRPCGALKSRTLLKVRFLNDPVHLLKL